MTSPEIGTWQRVTTGPQRGSEGVVDVIRTFPTGTFYRLSNRERIVGRFRAEQLEAIPNPQSEYQPLVTGAARQAALDMLTGGRVKA